MYVTAHYLFYMFSFFCNFILILSGCQKAVASSWFRQTPEVYGNSLIVEEVRFILKTEEIQKNMHIYCELILTLFYGKLYILWKFAISFIVMSPWKTVFKCPL